MKTFRFVARIALLATAFGLMLIGARVLSAPDVFAFQFPFAAQNSTSLDQIAWRYGYGSLALAAGLASLAAAVEPLARALTQLMGVRFVPGPAPRISDAGNSRDRPASLVAQAESSSAN